MAPAYQLIFVRGLSRWRCDSHASTTLWVGLQGACLSTSVAVNGVEGDSKLAVAAGQWSPVSTRPVS